MTTTRPVTGIIHNAQCRPGIELVAGRWPVRINGATNLLADLAIQGNAAGRSIIRALHAHQFRRQRDDHSHRHPGTPDA